MSENENLLSLLDIVQRTHPPGNWVEGDKIPWDEPSFSQRMLREHLSQDHNAASRRTDIIDAQVTWLHEYILEAKPSRVLDLACGPGFYAIRLAQSGHTCHGIDFSPASIAYAQENKANLANLEYTHSDVRTADYGSEFDMAMFIFGEFNVFRVEDARHILRKIHSALKPGGKLVLEPHTFEIVQEIGESGTSWYATDDGLFLAEPHLYLQENYWDDTAQVATTRYFIITMDGKVTRHASSMLAYTNEQYAELLKSCGFDHIEFYDSLQGNGTDKIQRGLLAIVAQRI